jgi:protein O-mannosyl-transferase
MSKSSLQKEQKDESIIPAKRQFALAGLLLFAAVCLLYARSFEYPLVEFDDNVYLNSIYTQQGWTWDSVRWAFSLATPLYWHPLTWLSHMLDAEVFGAGATGGPHVVNAFFHAANSVLLLALLRRLTGKFAASAGVALLFAVHPLRVESVIWLAERKDVLFVFFSLLAMRAYASYAGRPFQLWRYGLVFLACACAMMAKPTAVTLPFVLLLLDWWPLERMRPLRSRVVEKLPLLALSALTIRNVLISSPPEAGGAMEGFTLQGNLPLMVRLSHSATAYTQYLWVTLWPHPLALIYPNPAEIPVAMVALSLLLLLGITGVALRQSKRRPYLIAGWLWFLVTLTPVIGIVQRGAQSHADRFSYLPQIGLLVALVWLLFDWMGSRVRTAAWVVLAVAIVWSGFSWDRIGNWSNPFQLYAHDLQVTGSNPKLQLQYGQLLLGAGGEGRASGAESQFRAVLSANPRIDAARYGLANSLLVQKKYAEAADAFVEVLRVEPAVAGAHMGLGMADMNLAKKDDARAHFKEALRLGLNPSQAAHADSQ